MLHTALLLLLLSKIQTFFSAICSQKQVSQGLRNIMKVNNIYATVAFGTMH
jgi:hypothetical protein